MRNAIERATVSATRIEILLNESVVAEGVDRALTLPWTRPSWRRRREIIQRVGEAQQPPWKRGKPLPGSLSTASGCVPAGT